MELFLVNRIPLSRSVCDICPTSEWKVQVVAASELRVWVGRGPGPRASLLAPVTARLPLHHAFPCRPLFGAQRSPPGPILALPHKSKNQGANDAAEVHATPWLFFAVALSCSLCSVFAVAVWAVCLSCAEAAVPFPVASVWSTAGSRPGAVWVSHAPQSPPCFLPPGVEIEGHQKAG